MSNEEEKIILTKLLKEATEIINTDYNGYAGRMYYFSRPLSAEEGKIFNDFILKKFTEKPKEA